MMRTGHAGSTEARPWLLVSTEDGTDMFGAPVPAGTAVARQMWNGVTPWRPPPGVRVEVDDGRPIWQPQPPPPPPSGQMAVADWLRRLPPEVLHAVAHAALEDAGLLLALLLLAARGTLELSDPAGELRALLDLAVERTRGQPHALTRERAERMLAP
jgi:hypothetical protein